MKLNHLLLLELAQTIRVPPDGVILEHLLSRSLSHLEGAIKPRFTDILKYAPFDVQYFQLSITVNAIGEQIGLESSTSTTPPGTSSLMSPSQQESSPSQFDQLRAEDRLFRPNQHQNRSSSPTQQQKWDYDKPHPFESADLGNPTYEWCVCGNLRKNSIHIKQVQSPIDQAFAGRRPGTKHKFRGQIGNNCVVCDMPANARQHLTMYIYDTHVAHGDRR